MAITGRKVILFGLGILALAGGAQFALALLNIPDPFINFVGLCESQARHRLELDSTGDGVTLENLDGAKVIEVCSKAVLQSPRHGASYYRLARGHFKLKEYPQTVAALNTAIDLGSALAAALEASILSSNNPGVQKDLVRARKLQADYERMLRAAAANGSIPSKLYVGSWGMWVDETHLVAFDSEAFLKSSGLLEEAASSGYAAEVSELGNKIKVKREVVKTAELLNRLNISDALFDIASRHRNTDATIEVLNKHLWLRQQYSQNNETSRADDEKEKAKSALKQIMSTGDFGTGQKAYKFLNDLEAEDEKPMSGGDMFLRFLGAMIMNAPESSSNETAPAYTPPTYRPPQCDAQQAAIIAGTPGASASAYFAAGC